MVKCDKCRGAILGTSCVNCGKDYSTIEEALNEASVLRSNFMAQTAPLNPGADMIANLAFAKQAPKEDKMSNTLTVPGYPNPKRKGR